MEANTKPTETEGRSLSLVGIVEASSYLDAILETAPNKERAREYLIRLTTKAMSSRSTIQPAPQIGPLPEETALVEAMAPVLKYVEQTKGCPPNDYAAVVALDGDGYAELKFSELRALTAAFTAWTML